MNKMKQVRIEKLTLNVGAGINQDQLKKGIKLIKNLTGIEPVKTVTEKRIPAWGLRPGLPIGCKLTLRGNKVEDLITRLLAAKENLLSQANFDNYGNVSFGIAEYIDVPNLEYDSSIGIIGFQVTITLARQGNRIRYRNKLQRKVGKKHRVSQQDAIDFFRQKFNTRVEENK